MIVYKITNKINGKIYIGQTIKTLQRRWAVHKSCKRTSPLTSAFKKYGIENFTIEVIANCLDVSFLDKLETYLIAAHNSVYPSGYNLLANGNASNQRGKTPWNKGKKPTAKALRNQSLSHIGQTAWNKKAVICNETGQVFESLKQAAIVMKLQSSKICLVLKGIRRHTRGYTFKYKE
jgi:group I intron endonuclease